MFSLSGGPRADGLFADFINDIGQLHRIATAASPRLPVFLYGQSMGGMLAISYALHDTEHRLRGVIATSPWLRLSRIVQPKWWKVLLLKVSWPLFQEFLISSVRLAGIDWNCSNPADRTSTRAHCHPSTVSRRLRLMTVFAFRLLRFVLFSRSSRMSTAYRGCVHI